MTEKDNTAYCGIYCPDCIRYKNSFSKKAKDLIDALKDAEYDEYAAIESPFGMNIRDFPRFMQVLQYISVSQCQNTCRKGNGCSGVQCEIMKCCLSKDYQGCWECDEVDACDKFEFLTPRCGDTPKFNIKKIKEMGIDNWSCERHPFYVWKKP